MVDYVVGDATEPCVEKGTRVIIHVVNDAGKWGAGFSGAISKKWKEPEKYYRAQARFSKSFKLGEVQWVFIDPKLAVVNMIAQHGVSRDLLNNRPIRYDSLESCLDKVAEGARAVACLDGASPKRLTLHMPRIGCGLAGGTWDVVGGLVEENLWDLESYVYDLP